MKIDYPNSWTENYGAYCSGESSRILARTIFMIGDSFFGTVVMFFSDIIGRQKTGYLLSSVIILGVLLTYLTPNLQLKMMFISMVLGCHDSFLNLMYIIMNEFTGKISYI